MSREVVFLAWCAMCEEQGRERVEATSTYTIGIVRGENRPAPRVLDLCGDCEPTITELVDLLAERGLPPEFGKNGSAKAPAVKPVVPLPTGLVLRCRICQDRIATSSALITHVWSRHRPGETRPPQPTVCPDCHESFSRPQGMSIHRTVKHDYDALEAAYEGATT